MEGGWSGPHPAGPQAPTLVGAVGVCLVAVVPAVVVPVAGPVLGDAAPAVALELGARAGVAAARLIAVVPTVVDPVTQLPLPNAAPVPTQELV